MGVVTRVPSTRLRLEASASRRPDPAEPDPAEPDPGDCLISVDRSPIGDCLISVDRSLIGDCLIRGS